MPLNESKGNMYEFVNKTYNTIKGQCYHDCAYCFMKRWGKLNPVRLDERELKADLGTGNFIFVGSSCDMWAQNIPDEWIIKTLKHCAKFDGNKYLFQTKNPKNIRRMLPTDSHVCVTLESDIHYPEIMRNSPTPKERVAEMRLIRNPLYITIEPIMKFTYEFAQMLIECGAEQINIGADSGNNKLPEPDAESIKWLIATLAPFTKIHTKKNLKRLL